MVSDAGATRCVSFWENSTLPVCCSIKSAERAVKLIATSFFSSCAAAPNAPAAAIQTASSTASSCRIPEPFFMSFPSCKRFSSLYAPFYQIMFLLLAASPAFADKKGPLYEIERSFWG